MALVDVHAITHLRQRVGGLTKYAKKLLDKITNFIKRKYLFRPLRRGRYSSSLRRELLLRFLSNPKDE